MHLFLFVKFYVLLVVTDVGKHSLFSASGQMFFCTSLVILKTTSLRLSLLVVLRTHRMLLYIARKHQRRLC